MSSRNGRQQLGRKILKDSYLLQEYALTEKDSADDELGLVKFKLKALPTGENCSQRLVIRLQKPKKSFVINEIKRRVAFSPVFDNSGSDESNAPFCAVELNSKWIVLS